MELSKTNRDATSSFSNEEALEKKGTLGPQDNREVPQFIMGCNNRTQSRDSSKEQSSSQGSRKNESKRGENTSYKEEKKIRNSTQNSSQEEIRLMNLVTDVDLEEVGLEKISHLESKINLHSINELILNTVSSLTVLGNDAGYQLIECELLSQNNIPEAFFGVNMRLEQENGELRISFNNFGSPGQVNDAYDLVKANSAQLSSLINSLNKKSFLLKEFKIGHQAVQLPRIEEFDSPFNMIAANFKYYDDRNDKNDEHNQQKFSSHQEELEQIEEV